MAKKKLIEWLKLKYPEAAKINREKVVVIVSGAIEAHGPHLPLGTDFFAPQAIAQEVCRRAGAIYGPEIPYGCSETLMSLPGTLSIKPETLAGILRGLIGSFYRQGFKRFLVLSGHGDNPIGINLAFYHLISEKKDIILKMADWYHQDFTTVSQKLKYNVCHADKGETEMIMICDPSLVEMKKAKDLKNPQKKLPLGWRADLRKYFPFAVGGEPTKANLGEAKLLFENVVGKICKVVRQLEKRER